MPIPEQRDLEKARVVIRDWLAGQLPDARDLTISELTGPAFTGFSNETLLFDATWTEGGEARSAGYVIRVKPTAHTIFLEADFDSQYKVIKALSEHTDVPLPPVHWYEDDESVLGAPFFVMGHVAGQVPVEDPPYTTAGFFLDVAPADRTRMIERGLATVARVHAVDWRTAGLDWLVPRGTMPGLDAQLALWEAYYRAELRGRELPIVDRALAWLHAERPRSSPVGLCWGDPRPGNIIWRDATPVCVTDFEAASIAPPELDVGWWLMFDRTMHEGAGVERPDGDPRRDEQLRMYEAASGRAVPDVRWFEICAAARYCAIVVRVMNRAVDRGLMPEDHTIWLENPASAALQSLMDELAI
jgi:aminoglycoside phosphotransferase (APT) family kinase protein